MTEPSVCAVCITADRPEMAARAVRSYSRQTYGNAWLLIYNTGESDEIECGCNAKCFHVKNESHAGKSVGAIRNIANAFRSPFHPASDIIVHFDDDDWSHPNRIAEQVAYLQSSGCDAVGYREMLFWDTARHPLEAPAGPGGEAWLYSNTDPVYCLGTSLCYWRTVWEARPFPDKTTGEDFFWLQGVNGQPRLKSRGVEAFAEPFHGQKGAPRMIATIHGGNIASRIQAGTMEWQRAAAWDDTVRKTLEGA